MSPKITAVICLIGVVSGVALGQSFGRFGGVPQPLPILLRTAPLTPQLPVLVRTEVQPAPTVLVKTEPHPQIPILSRSEVRNENGAYSFSYESGDRTTVNEQGTLRSTPQGDVIVTQGSFSFYSPEGVPYQIRYIADENGFQPQGAHIPVAPSAPLQ